MDNLVTPQHETNDETRMKEIKGWQPWLKSFCAKKKVDYRLTENLLRKRLPKKYVYEA